MARFKRIDSFDVTYADSFTRKELKVRETFIHTDGTKAKKGVGEKRIYCGHDEEALDRFFRFDENPVFFIQKDDLEEYASSIEKEYLDPVFHYGDGVDATYSLYKEYRKKLSNLDEDRLEIHFSKKYDNQNRYYIGLPRRSSNTMKDHENYSYLHDICLPRVTRLLFIKLVDLDSPTKQVYIYLKPFYGSKISGTKTTGTDVAKTKEEPRRSAGRPGQEKYKQAVFEYYSYCVVTRVTDPNLLIACHIKDFSECDPHEEYDKFNGFTMTPTIHALFDLGYLTFNATGDMVLSDFFRNMDRKNLNLNRSVRIDIREESQKYLQWHNEHVFIKTSKGVQISE